MEKVIQRKMKKRSERACGCMTSVVFHLCVVDVLINSVRFSFWRLHGVLHADSEGNMQVANRTERRLISSTSFAYKYAKCNIIVSRSLWLNCAKNMKMEFDCTGRRSVAVTCRGTDCTSDFTAHHWV